MSSIDPIRKNHVTVTGNPDASRTIVFSHGFGTDQSAWAQIVPAFVDDFRIVLYDHVGAGRSDPAAFVQHRYLTLNAYVSDLLDICAALGLEDAIAVGHSMGGMVSLLAAIRQPRHFSKLVLIGASPRYLDDGEYHGGLTPDGLDAVYSAMHANLAGWADGFAPGVMGVGNPRRFADYFAETLKRIPKDRALTVACAIFQSDHRADLPELDKPTLLIQTAHDVAVPIDAANYLHAHIRGSRLEVIEATGHLPHVTAPEVLLPAIEPFIRSN